MESYAVFKNKANQAYTDQEIRLWHIIKWKDCYLLILSEGIESHTNMSNKIHFKN